MQALDTFGNMLQADLLRGDADQIQLREELKQLGNVGLDAMRQLISENSTLAQANASLEQQLKQLQTAVGMLKVEEKKLQQSKPNLPLWGGLLASAAAVVLPLLLRF
jgi:hypothetical protein